MLARFHSGADKLKCGVQAAHGLHHDVDVVQQNVLKILGDGGIGQLHILQADHLGNRQAGNIFNKIVHTAANNAKAQQRNIHG